MQTIRCSRVLFQLHHHTTYEMVCPSVITPSSQVLIPLQEQSTGEFHTFMDYYKAMLPGFLVPQSVYVSPTPYTPLQPIRFFTGNIPGVNLRALCGGHTQTMANAVQLAPLPPNENKTHISVCLQVIYNCLRVITLMNG